MAAAIAAPAVAHLGLESPSSRYGPNVLKEGPCGVPGGQRSNNVTVLEPGASIEVVWDEYVDHPGHFRIAFDADGDDDFVDPPCLSGCNTRNPEIELYSNETVLLDGIADTPRGGEGSAMVTLPDVECERCTLQVIQVMYDKPPYVIPGNDIYYQCADVVLRRSQPLPTVTATATPEPPTATPSPAFTASATILPTCAVGRSDGCVTLCVGDCDGSDAVSVDEIITMVTIALGRAGMSACASGDTDASGNIEVNEIVTALRSSLHGCP
jgi:hypothetical protein